LPSWHFYFREIKKKCQLKSIGTIYEKQFKSILTKKIQTMALQIKPLSDRVLIEPVAAETKTASGIYIPDTAKEKPQKGTVIAVGNGTKDHTMTVKIGDTVLYGKYAGTELKLDGIDYLIMREDDILAIV
jgi:chaperonin GroES